MADLEKVLQTLERPETGQKALPAGSLTTLGEPNNDTLTYATKRIATSYLSTPI
jgi:hypothetical protein